MGKFGGVQAFVTSHQTIDDEKDIYGAKSASSIANPGTSNVRSVLNIHGPASSLVPQLSKNANFFTSGNRTNARGDESDSDSVSDADMKAFPESNLGGH